MYNPFENNSCDVFRKDYVHVQRIAGKAADPARFRKTFLDSKRGDFRYWNNRENQLLLLFRQLHLKRVVQTATVAWNARDEFDFIETLDAGPSLYDWLRVQPRERDGTISPHPFANAGSLLALLKGAVQALSEIHRAGFVHGDVREGNICIPILVRSSDGQWISPDSNRLRLIDFAFSLSSHAPLQQPLPIEPTTTLHSPAYFLALEKDSTSGTPRQVEQLDWRVDLYSLGELLKRLLEKHVVMWPGGKVGHDIRNRILRLLANLLRLDSDGSRLDDNTHDNLLMQIASAASLLGAHKIDAFTIHTLTEQPLVLGIGNSSAIRHAATERLSATCNSTVSPAATPLSAITPIRLPNPPPPRAPIVVPRSRLAAGLHASSPGPLQNPLARSWIGNLWEQVEDSISIERFRKRASQGDPEGCYRIGLVFARGKAVSQDFVAASQWFHQAANVGHSGAQTSIAWMCELGMGVERNEQLAIEWYLRAARQNHPVALFNLAVMVADGRGTPKDDRQAVEYLVLAANAGVPDAFFSLGKMVLAGRGITRDYEHAIEYFRRAIELKHGAAARELGRLLEHGVPGRSPNPTEAIKWFRKAQHLGYSAATNDIQRLSHLFST